MDKSSQNAAWLRDKASLMLRTKTLPGQPMQVLVEAMDDELRAFLGLPADKKVEGQAAYDLFAYDRPLVDEWMEFLLKMRVDPSSSRFDKRSGNKVTRKTLQFFQMVKRWAVVDLTLDLYDGSILVEIYPPREEQITVGVRHLMGIKQALWLEEYVDTGGNWEIDLVNETIYVSRKIAKMLKIADNSVIIPLERIVEMIPVEDFQYAENLLVDMNTVSTALTNRCVLADGTVVYFNTYAIPAVDEEGEITRIIGHSRDITGQQQALERLALSEQRFRGIVESSSDIFVVLSPEGRIVYVSPNVAEILGYSLEDLMDQSFDEFIVYRGKQKMNCRQFIRVMRGKTYAQGDYEVRKADGETMWFSTKMSSIRDADNNIIEVVAVCRDVTEDKKKEEVLKYMSAHDALTGAFNRFYFEQELVRFDSEGTEFGLVMADLNGLKLINDAFGHSRGDALLKEAAEALIKICGGMHQVYRIGGDEFAVLTKGGGPEELERICEELEQFCKISTDEAILLSISCGTAYRTDPSQNTQSIFNQAESRMYSNKMLDSRSMRSQMLSSLKETLKVRDVETAEHMRRMENMVMAMGKRLKLPTSEFDRLVLLASMHDIGKVAIPDHIIKKTGTLTDEEWEIMRTHSEIGCRIALSSQELSAIANEICCHHENWDGSGYPFGYNGEDIPLLSRIISVVDAYDVMTHQRCYKFAYGHRDALEELRRCSGNQFDPAIVELFLDMFGGLSPEDMKQFISKDPMVHNEMHQNDPASILVGHGH